MSREKLLHCLSVFTNAGECGWLIYWKRVPKKVLEAMEELPDSDDSWSLESELGIFLPEDLYEEGLDCIESAAEVVWCEECLEGHPCDAWKVDFDEIGFMPRNPDATKAKGEGFNLKKWIKDRKEDWQNYKHIAEEVRGILEEFVDIARQVKIPGKSGMSSSEAARLLGIVLPCSQDDIKTAFKKAAMEAHPDRAGGSAEKMKKVIAARDALLS